MKVTSVARPTDKLGRIVIPKELRDAYNIIEHKTKIEFSCDGRDTIFIRPVRDICLFCGEEKDSLLVHYHNQLICKNCIKELQEKIK